MGTSNPRRGPGTPAWRRAKGAATRYMAPEEAKPLEARELVRRYVAALEETGTAPGQDLHAAFRLTRKLAQKLGELAERTSAVGLPAALQDLGLPPLASHPPYAAALELTALWLDGEFGLEAAVTGTALAASLEALWVQAGSPAARLSGPALVKFFLGQALWRRLALDLGESLEAAASDWQLFKQRLNQLAGELTTVAETLAPADPAPRDWQGLSGWLWVTQTLRSLLEYYF